MQVIVPSQSLFKDASKVILVDKWTRTNFSMIYLDKAMLF